MSFNIGKQLFEISDEITLKINLDHLGPIQRKSLISMCNSGVAFGNGVVADVAIHLLRMENKPRIWSSNWRCGWNDIPLDNTHPLRALLIANFVLEKMRPIKASATQWRVDSLAAMDHAVHNETSVSGNRLDLTIDKKTAKTTTDLYDFSKFFSEPIIEMSVFKREIGEDIK